MAAIDQIPKSNLPGILSAIKSTCSCTDQINTLFDHHQSHSINGLTEPMLTDIQLRLKQIGATKFRKVRVKNGTTILCFYAGNIK